MGYNPVVGTFVERDPVEADPNLYRHCGTNPINYLDSAGLKAVPAASPTVTEFGFYDFDFKKEQLPKIGSFDFEDFVWAATIEPFPKNLTQVWLYQDFVTSFRIYDRNRRVILQMEDRKVDSNSYNLRADHSVTFHDYRESQNTILRKWYNLAQDYGHDCVRYELRITNSLRFVSGVELNRKGVGWIVDDGKKHHSHGSMINLPTEVVVAAVGGNPELREASAGEVTDARAIGESYFGPVTWTQSVNGHFDNAGKPIVDSGKIDFSAFKPTALFPRSLTSPVYEYKRKE